MRKTLGPAANKQAANKTKKSQHTHTKYKEEIQDGNQGTEAHSLSTMTPKPP
jgi:hypothetical protein